MTAEFEHIFMIVSKELYSPTEFYRLIEQSYKQRLYHFPTIKNYSLLLSLQKHPFFHKDLLFI